ncbi:MAG: type II toxin-antitoxin system VapC family toxin [Alphaproteobacteria bacterium]|nr:type II toxin-antitoxin system VapC family toxin [Alphaproteobacteria bacterium]
MSDVVLDSSAVLALLAGEPGADLVKDALPGALLSAVNLAEIVAKLTERGMPAAEAASLIDAIGIEVVAFDALQAVRSGALRPSTRAAGLSLGDRACLALADARALPVLTADNAWRQLDQANINLIR